MMIWWTKPSCYNTCLCNRPLSSMSDCALWAMASQPSEIQFIFCTVCSSQMHFIHNSVTKNGVQSVLECVHVLYIVKPLYRGRVSECAFQRWWIYFQWFVTDCQSTVILKILAVNLNEQVSSSTNIVLRHVWGFGKTVSFGCRRMLLWCHSLWLPRFRTLCDTQRYFHTVIDQAQTIVLFEAHLHCPPVIQYYALELVVVLASRPHKYPPYGLQAKSQSKRPGRLDRRIQW